MPHQRQILLSPARRKLVLCGRRWGKTVAGLLAAVKGHGPERGVFRGAADGAKILWTAPTFIIASDIWRELKRSTAEAIVEKSEVEKRLELVGGGMVRVGSTDNPMSLRGSGWDGAIMDEAAFMAQVAWREAIRPALSDRRGWALFITTPNGFNWVKELFDQAGITKGWERWQRPTSDNPLILPEELEEARRDMGERAYAQEHLAQFVDTEGAEFAGEYFGDHIWFDDWPTEIRHKILSLDPSKGKSDKADFSAYVLMALGHDGKLYVDADIQRRDVWRIVDDGLDLCAAWHPDAVGVETNQFQEVLAGVINERSRERNMLLPLYGINNTENKRTRIRATLTPFLARGDIRFKRDSQGARLLVEQLRAFPLGEHDDGPDALEMAVRLLRFVFEGGLQDDGSIRQERAVT